MFLDIDTAIHRKTLMKGKHNVDPTCNIWKLVEIDKVFGDCSERKIMTIQIFLFFFFFYI